VNHSIYSADRMTHLKIIVVALIAGVGVMSVGISIRLSSDDSSVYQHSSVYQQRPHRN
jgi:hypothetical protein